MCKFKIDKSKIVKRKGIDFLMQNVQTVNLFFDKEVFYLSLYYFFWTAN